MVERLFTTAALVGLCWTAVPHAQELQPPAGEWQGVSERLQPAGWEVVERLDGSTVKGEFVRLSPDAIEIRPRTRFPVPPVRVPLTEIRTIRQGSRDSLLNGAVWGGATGAASGILVLCAWTAAEGGGNCFTGWDPDWIPLYTIGLGTGIGLGVGMGLDALFTRRSLIYTRPPATAATARLAPLVGPGVRGIQLSVLF